MELVARYGSEKPYRIAQAHAWRDERDHAFEWLQRALDQHSLPLRNVKSDPLLRKVRRDPRYVAILEKMNLPVD